MNKVQSINSKSGNLIEAAYDAATGKCQVRFKGNGLYENEAPIPPAIYAQFEATFANQDSSSGSFYHQNLKQFNFKKIS